MQFGKVYAYKYLYMPDAQSGGAGNKFQRPVVFIRQNVENNIFFIFVQAGSNWGISEPVFFLQGIGQTQHKVALQVFCSGNFRLLPVHAQRVFQTYAQSFPYIE